MRIPLSCEFITPLLEFSQTSLSFSVDKVCVCVCVCVCVRERERDRQTDRQRETERARASELCVVLCCVVCAILFFDSSSNQRFLEILPTLPCCRPQRTCWSCSSRS